MNSLNILSKTDDQFLTPDTASFKNIMVIKSRAVTGIKIITLLILCND